MTRGFFGVAIYHPKHETNVGSLWRAASLHDAALCATVGQRYKIQASDTMVTRLHTPLIHFDDIEDLIRHLPFSTPLIGVELDPRATPLHEYIHPERAMYLLGAEDHGLPPAVVDRCHDLIMIPTPVTHSMNVACAGSIVMNHRYMTRVKGKVEA